MLQVIINKTLADLSPDISISLSFANPLFEDDKIPTPHSYSFDLPATTANLAIIGHAERIPSTNSEQIYYAEVIFDGISLIEGNLSINEIKRDVINVEIECAAFIDQFKKKLHQNDLGRVSFGIAKPSPRGLSVNPEANAQAFLNFWEAQLNNPAPDYVAASLAIKDAEWVPIDVEEDRRPSSPDRDSVNIRTMRINQRSKTGYDRSRIVPSIRIAYILNRLRANLGNVFESDELKKLMLVCNYHPNYYNLSSWGVAWTIDPTTNEVYIEFADYVPDIETGVFINELLKAICASLYTIKGEPVIALAKTILTSTEAIDWSDKIVDGYSISLSKKENYRFSFDCDEDEELSIDSVIKDYTDIFDMIFSRRNNTENLCRVVSTGQVFDSQINAALSDETHFHYSFKLVKDSSAVQQGPIKYEDIEVREITSNVIPVRSVIVEEVPRDGQRGPSFNSWQSQNHYNYIPEVEKVEKTRPTNIYIGHYVGLQDAIITPDYTYPQITARGIEPAIPLVGTGSYNVLHTDFSKWLYKTKRIIKCQVLLDPIDVQDLDLRKKIAFKGRNFLIESLDIAVKATSIGLADLTLVEV